MSIETVVVSSGRRSVEDLDSIPELAAENLDGGYVQSLNAPVLDYSTVSVVIFDDQSASRRQLGGPRDHPVSYVAYSLSSSSCSARRTSGVSVPSLCSC